MTRKKIDGKILEKIDGKNYIEKLTEKLSKKFTKKLTKKIDEKLKN